MPVTIQQLGPERLRYIVESSQAKPAERARRLEYARRAMIMADRYGDLVFQRIAEVYDKATTHQHLAKFVNAGTNVMSRVVRELAYVYARPPSRQLQIAGVVGQALNKRLTDAYAQANIAAQAKQWGQYAFALNVVWVVPGVWQRIDGLKIEYDLVLPTTAERITSDDPRYTDILLWPGKLDDAGKPTIWHATDGDAYYWLDHRFMPIRVVPHGLGRQPAVELRVSLPPPGEENYWDVGRGSKLVDATLECGRTAAAMLWVRQGQNRRLVTAFGDTGALDNSQASSPEAAIIGRTQNPESIQFAVHDFVTAVDEFKAEMRWHVEQVVESYGIPITTVDPEPASTGDAVNVFAPAAPQLHAAKSELRSDQIEYARPFEVQLALNTHEIAARRRHPLSISPDVIRAALQVRWAPMTYVDQPMNRLNVYTAKMALGLMTHADAWIEEYGGSETADEAHERVMGNLRRKAEIDLFYAQHNVGQDPRVEALPQIQGRAGGQAPRQEAA